jgi:hypothetical protein
MKLLVATAHGAVVGGAETYLRAKLEWVRDAPADARAMGYAGRRRVLERFTWPTVVRRCLAAYLQGR